MNILSAPGFCKVRLITMSLRMAWACYPRNISLGIAAQVFVYVGTIILYLCNWFFAQRVVRAQHPHIGWSTPYRILHRTGIIALIVALLMIVVASIQQFFTLDPTLLRVDRALQLAAFTYFGAFTLAPLGMILISVILPRKETEKFGAGRLRNAIAVLFVGSFILALGQCFRTITGWLPAVPLRNPQGQFSPVPWYFSKACFYCFNFLTELLVVIFYAVMRVDLRFYVPDGAKKPGDYRAYRESQSLVAVIGNEERLKRHTRLKESVHSVNSNETLHKYDASVFEDTRTLADSLRFQSSVMEIDDKTGNWKIKRPSNSKNSSVRSSSRPSNRSQSFSWDPTRNTFIEQLAPPVPSMTQPEKTQQTGDWPLRTSQIHLGQVPVKEHLRSRSSSSPARASYLHHSTEFGRIDAIDMAMKKLDGSATSKHDFVVPEVPKPVYHTSSNGPEKHAYTNTAATPDMSRNKDYSPSSPASSDTLYTNTSPTSIYTANSVGFLTKGDDSAPAAAVLQRQPSSAYSDDKNSSTSTEEAEREFARFSFVASPRIGSFEEE
jgi:hypothetical protein